MSIKIQVKGYGNEIVIGTITNEEIEKINDYNNINNIDNFGDFYSSNSNEELGFTSWWEKDDLRHVYGPNEESEIIITNGDDDVLFSGVIDNLNDITPLFSTRDEEYNSDSDNQILFGKSTERGNWQTIIDIGDEEFQIEKLGIVKTSLELYSNNEYVTDGVVFEKLVYDGVEYELELESGYIDNLSVEIAKIR